MCGLCCVSADRESQGHRNLAAGANPWINYGEKVVRTAPQEAFPFGDLDFAETSMPLGLVATVYGKGQLVDRTRTFPWTAEAGTAMGYRTQDAMTGVGVVFGELRVGVSVDLTRPTLRCLDVGSSTLPGRDVLHSGGSIQNSGTLTRVDESLQVKYMLGFVDGRSCSSQLKGPGVAVEMAPVPATYSTPITYAAPNQERGPASAGHSPPIVGAGRRRRRQWRMAQ